MSATFERRQFFKTAAAGVVAASGTLAYAQTAAVAAPQEAPLTVGLNPADANRPPFQAQTSVRALRIADLNDLEAEAKKLMDPGAFAFISSGSDSQWTLHENRAAFGRVALKPQYLVGKPAPDLRTSLLGHQLSMPIITTPMGAHGLAHQSAELGTARGTAEAGTLMTVSTMANHTIEDIAAANKGPKWFQLYMPKSRDEALALLRRAEAAGYTAIVFAIDAFAPGSSDSTIRMQFSMPASLKLVNAGQSGYKTSLGWDDVKFIQQNTKLPLVLKGVLTPEMAKLALQHGVAAIQVSNHGGRQLDGVLSSARALPASADAVKGQIKILADSGIRNGLDIVRMLALGADCTMIGRAFIYALAADGGAGVSNLLDLLEKEMRVAMTLTSVKNVSEITGNLLVKEG